MSQKRLIVWNLSLSIEVTKGHAFLHTHMAAIFSITTVILVQSCSISFIKHYVPC